MTFHLRVLTPADQPKWRALRLEALERNPAAFLTTAEEQRNRPASEDSIDLLTRADVGLVLDGTGFSFFEDASTSSDPLFREAWRTFLFAMLFFLIGEAILSNDFVDQADAFGLLC